MNLPHIIYKFQTTPPGIRRDIVSERILLPIFLQHVFMNSRGKSPRSAARMIEDAISCLIFTIVYELGGQKIAVDSANSRQRPGKEGQILGVEIKGLSVK